MSSKLDLLAQKEEELWRLNEELELKNKQILEENFMNRQDEEKEEEDAEEENEYRDA